MNFIALVVFVCFNLCNKKEKVKKMIDSVRKIKFLVIGITLMIGILASVLN